MAARTRAGGWARMLAAVLAVVAFDQVTKRIATAAVERGDSVNVFLGLDISNTRNTGVAFGALADSGTIVAVLIAGALTALIAFFALNARRPWLWLPAGLLLGGALGNLVDRIREGAVVDFIDPIAWPAFNFADTCIVIGVVALLYVSEVRPGEDDEGGPTDGDGEAPAGDGDAATREAPSGDGEAPSG